MTAGSIVKTEECRIKDILDAVERTLRGAYRWELKIRQHVDTEFYYLPMVECPRDDYTLTLTISASPVGPAEDTPHIVTQSP